MQDNFNDAAIIETIEKEDVPFKRVPKGQLYNIKQEDNLQGIIAETELFKYVSFDELVSGAKKGHTLIFLDRVYDPQNLGAIIRTVACFGGFSVVIPKHNACEVNETVLHVASGGENHVPVSRVSNLPSVLIEAKKNGYWITGAMVRGGQDITKTQLSFPLAIVLGSEGEGVRYGVGKHLDFKVFIPMQGAALSFNVTIACAVFCYEVTRQR